MKDKKKIIGVIAIIVAILAIAVTIGMYFYHNAKPEEKKETAKGTIELIVRDQKGILANAGRFKLSHILAEDNKEEIMQVTTGKDGIVDFYNVPEGEYELEVIEEKEGYSFAEDSKVKRFHVAPDTINTVSWDCTRKNGIIVATVLDKEEKPIQNMEVELIDKDGNVIETHKTTVDGWAFIHIQEEGTYYFRQNPDCEKAKEYE